MSFWRRFVVADIPDPASLSGSDVAERKGERDWGGRSRKLLLCSLLSALQGAKMRDKGLEMGEGEEEGRSRPDVFESPIVL